MTDCFSGVDFIEPSAGWTVKVQLTDDQKINQRTLFDELGDNGLASLISSHTLLSELRRPHLKRRDRVVAANNLFRIGDPERYPDSALQFAVKIAKATAKENAPTEKKINRHTVGRKAIAGQLVETEHTGRADLIPSEPALPQGMQSLASLYGAGAQDTQGTAQKKLIGREGENACAGGDVMSSKSYLFVPDAGQTSTEDSSSALHEDSKVMDLGPITSVDPSELIKVWRFGSTLISVHSEEDSVLEQLSLPQGLDLICCIPRNLVGKLSSSYLDCI